MIFTCVKYSPMRIVFNRIRSTDVFYLNKRKLSINTIQRCKQSPPFGNQQQQQQTNRKLHPMAIKAKQFFYVTKFLIFIGVGYVAYRLFYSKSIKDKWSKISQHVVTSPYFQSNLGLLKYEGCVLPSSIAHDGSLEIVKEFEVRSSDIFIASFPKSGTTWLQEIVYLLCHLNKEEPAELKDSVMETKFPYLEYPYPGIKEINNRQGQRFLKTHLPKQLLPDKWDESGAKLLYIHRNPKDVVVSYFHFCKMLVYINYTGPFDEFTKLFRQNRVAYTPFFDHINDYKNLCESNPEKCLLLSYEDLKSDPIKEIEKIAKFLKIDATTEQIKEVASKTSLESMRKNPRTNYEHWDIYGLRTKNSQPFLRKGEVGDYVNYFNPDELYAQEFDEWIQNECKSYGINFTYNLPSKS